MNNKNSLDEAVQLGDTLIRAKKKHSSLASFSPNGEMLS